MTEEEKRIAHAAYMRDYYYTPQNAAYRLKRRPAQAAYQRQWNRERLEHRREINRRSYAKHQPKRQGYNRARYAADPSRGKANAYVSSAIKRGRLQRPDTCSMCGVKAEIEAHHHKGYERQFWLDVIWVCIPCHRKCGQAVHPG